MEFRTKGKLSVSAALVFGSVFASLVGIPGMMESWAGWMEWVNKARVALPWEWAMVSAGIMGVGAVLPWISDLIALRRTSSKPRDPEPPFDWDLLGSGGQQVRENPNRGLFCLQADASSQSRADATLVILTCHFIDAGPYRVYSIPGLYGIVKMDGVPMAKPASLASNFASGISYTAQGSFQINQYLTADEDERLRRLIERNGEVRFSCDELRTYTRSDDPSHAGKDLLLGLQSVVLTP